MEASDGAIQLFFFFALKLGFPSKHRRILRFSRCTRKVDLLVFRHFADSYRKPCKSVCAAMYSPQLKLTLSQWCSCRKAMSALQLGQHASHSTHDSVFYLPLKSSVMSTTKARYGSSARHFFQADLMGHYEDFITNLRHRFTTHTLNFGHITQRPGVPLPLANREVVAARSYHAMQPIVWRKLDAVSGKETEPDVCQVRLLETTTLLRSCEALECGVPKHSWFHLLQLKLILCEGSVHTMVS